MWHFLTASVSEPDLTRPGHAGMRASGVRLADARGKDGAGYLNTTGAEVHVYTWSVASRLKVDRCLSRVATARW
jgi:hypothetical protein